MTKLLGKIQVPGDKSISHRSVMFASLAKGKTYVNGFLEGADCLSTISCFKKLGIEIERNKDKVIIEGKGLRGLQKSEEILDCGNSGTTTRLISGILVAQGFDTILTGDESIKKRPMNRIITPLSLMGANIKSTNDGYAPLYINGTNLHGIDYISPVASAQVKSAILLAGLYAEGKTGITEPLLSRNHTELMLKSFGADIESIGTKVSIKKCTELYANNIEIPGDISSAAFFIVGASICKGSDLLIKNVGINPTRDGILKISKQMGANIELLNISDTEEKKADIRVKYSNLKGTIIGGDIIPSLIDEIPIIAAMAVFAEGKTIIKDAGELKVKESNRIKVMVSELQKIGVDIVETDDGMIINGNPNYKFNSATIDSHKDHRIAMTFSILNLVSDNKITIIDKNCVDISYPNFYKDLQSISR
jgi:hypothetical protein